MDTHHRQFPRHSPRTYSHAKLPPPRRKFSPNKPPNILPGNFTRHRIPLDIHLGTFPPKCQLSNPGNVMLVLWCNCHHQLQLSDKTRHQYRQCNFWRQVSAVHRWWWPGMIFSAQQSTPGRWVAWSGTQPKITHNYTLAWRNHLQNNN